MTTISSMDNIKAKEGFFPYTNILCPATVGTTVGCFWERACTAQCEIFYGKHVAL
jgi:hypothetical protein